MMMTGVVPGSGIGNPAKKHQNRRKNGTCPGGGIGRHRGFKIPRLETAMRVQVPPWALRFTRFDGDSPPIAGDLLFWFALKHFRVCVWLPTDCVCGD